jgi:hypothetical protein
MNKLSKIAAATVLTLTLLAPGLAAAATDSMKAMVDYSDVRVESMDKLELVPLREMAEKLGFEVNWDAKAHFITLTCTKQMSMIANDSKMMDDSKMMNSIYMVKVKVGSKKITVDGVEKILTKAPVTLSNKTYVSKAFVEMYLANQAMMK